MAKGGKETIKEQKTSIICKIWDSYNENTPNSLKLIDAYLVMVMMSGILQFVYMIVSGSYPFNAFLAGFSASVGSFVLTANLRIQSNPENKEFSEVSRERAFADFALGSIILYGFAVNYLG